MTFYLLHPYFLLLAASFISIHLLASLDVTDCFVISTTSTATININNFHRGMPITTSSPTSVALAGRESFEDKVANANPNDDTNITMMPNDPRSCILRVGADAGRLCAIANTMLDTTDESVKTELTSALLELFVGLWLTSKSLRLNWVRSIRAKMELNAKKYPVEHCKVRTALYLIVLLTTPYCTTPYCMLLL